MPQEEEKGYSMRNVIGSTLIATLSCVAVGCVSSVSPVTPEQLAESEATIRSAESAGAFERAPDLLQKARQALSAAQQASGRGDHKIAREHLVETVTYAEAARARAQAVGKNSEAAMVRQQADQIEAKAKLLQQQLQNP